ncbi:hypothetical protein MKX03_012992 [Papaver bracteatum]|nr:hypothetical protein MKX03_012992 [Papaver bracteatum]
MENKFFNFPVKGNCPFLPGKRNFTSEEICFPLIGCEDESRVKRGFAWEGTVAHFEPKLEEEDTVLDQKAKLYRFDKDEYQWKQRGLLKHKHTEKVRLVMRQSKTLRVCANHQILPTISIEKHVMSENSWLWHAADFADGVLKEEVFCARFASTGNAKEFQKMIAEAAAAQMQRSEESEKLLRSLAANLG